MPRRADAGSRPPGARGPARRPGARRRQRAHAKRRRRPQARAPSFPALQERVEARERLVRRRRRRFGCGSRCDAPRLFLLSLMLVVVTVDAQQFPVAAIGRIVVVVVIAMMDGELPHGRVVELAPAATADPRVDLECPLAVTLLAFVTCASSFGDDAVEPRLVWFL